ELIRLSADGYEIKAIERLDALFGRNATEEYGVEDARITQLGDEYLITYVSVSSTMGVATSLMTTRDFKTFERHGVIFETENKDVVIFPEKIAGAYHALHRPVENINIRPLAIMAAESPDLAHWGRHRYVLGCAPEPGWYSRRIGAGPPPVRTDEGWLTIFHGVRQRHPGDPIGEYSAGALLTALDEPWRPVAVSAEPFLFPEEEWEVSGYVGNVVFPTGAAADLEDPDRLHVYYGCADSCVAVATFSTREIVAHLKRL
ncbi:MAG: glycoside hydrolase family 130 protein, partial [Planctomycetota bacterium]